jgi:hypothetical protein
VEEYVDDKGVEHVAAALPQTEEEPIKEGEDSEETLEGLKEMAMGDLERIADYANMILERMGQGQNLDSWMYSQITLAVDQLNSVHDTMDGTDGVKESVNESLIKEDIDTMYLVVGLIAQLGALGQLGFSHIGDYERKLGPIDSIKQWWKDKKDDKVVKSIIAKIKSDPEMIEFFKLSQNQQKGKFRKLVATKLSSDEIQYLNRINKSDLQQTESVNEEKVYIDYLNKEKGFKQDRIKFNSYEEAVKWAKKNFEKFNSDMIKYESINELTNNEKQIKNGNPNNVFYAFYKGQFEAVYWAMNPTDLFNIYWDEFKVRRPAGSKFKLNPEFIIVPKKEYDNSTSNR